MNGTLAQVRERAGDLGDALANAWSHTAAGSGGSRIVADALAGFVESQREDVGTITDRLEAAPSGVSRAVAAYLEGDEDMARATERLSAGADAASSGENSVNGKGFSSSGVYGPPVPAPGGYGPPVPPQPVAPDGPPLGGDR